MVNSGTITVEVIFVTIQALHFLCLLKKAQGKENEVVLLHTREMKAASRISAGQERTSPIVDISRYKSSLDSVLDFLQNKKYIEFENVPDRKTRVIMVKVNHAGWHLLQTGIGRMLSFLLRSIAVPITVSILTTILTLKVTEWLSGM